MADDVAARVAERRFLECCMSDGWSISFQSPHARAEEITYNWFDTKYVVATTHTAWGTGHVWISARRREEDDAIVFQVGWGLPYSASDYEDLAHGTDFTTAVRAGHQKAHDLASKQMAAQPLE